MPIPPFDHNRVLPPYMGDPTRREDVSPYLATTLDLCQRFGAINDRRTEILIGYLNFRKRLNQVGLQKGFQWLNGSFLQDIENQKNRPPDDLDLVTFYSGYDMAFQADLHQKFPEFFSVARAKAKFLLHHFSVDADFKPLHTVSHASYFCGLFTHSREQVWKGIVRIELNTPETDEEAAKHIGL